MKLKSALLGAAAVMALAPAAFAERGSDGQVNILYYQAVSIMNAYLSIRHQGHRGRDRWCWSRWPASTRRASCSRVWSRASRRSRTAASRQT